MNYLKNLWYRLLTEPWYGKIFVLIALLVFVLFWIAATVLAGVVIYNIILDPIPVIIMGFVFLGIFSISYYFDQPYRPNNPPTKKGKYRE